MSNLVKGFNVYNSQKDARVIDNNEMLMRKLESIKIKLYEQKEMETTDGFVAGLEVEKVEDLISDEEYAANMQKKADDTINDAKNQAEAIIKEAMEQAEAIKLEAYNRAYEEGKKKSLVENEKFRIQLESDYNAKKNALDDEYTYMKEQLEPQLVMAITEVFDKVTRAVADVDKSVIMHLITSVLDDIETGKNFVIKVSPQDYQFVNDNISKLYKNISNGAMIEVCQDDKLSKNQSIIETDSGVFDCSLDVQLEGLIKEIKVLSCI